MTKPAILVISSHVVRGTVGNRAAVFALETLGFPVWAVPTVTLPWHPGHGPATRIVPPADAFAAMLADLEGAPWLGEVGGVLTGYLGSAEQAAPIARLIAAVKARNTGALYVCDPVIGDRGGLYVPQATAEAIRDRLLPLADIATPNRAELDWLAGMAGETLEDIAAMARSLPPRAMLVTSAPAGDGRIGNLWVEDEMALLASHGVVARPPNGLGDLTAALLLAQRLGGKSAQEAIRHVTAAVFEILSRAAARGADELMLETDATSLAAPKVTVRTTSAGDGEPSAMPTCVGVDGYKKGWVAVSRDANGELNLRTHEAFDELVGVYSGDAIIAVDMPIGLPDWIGPDGRGPEKAVRRLLGKLKSSVFPIPSRQAIYDGHFFDASERSAANERAKITARKTSHHKIAFPIQAFGLFPKIRLIDEALRTSPDLRSRVIESHPEAAFWKLNDEHALANAKSTVVGAEERRELLRRHGITEEFLSLRLAPGMKQDDFLDACAMLLVAERHARGEAIPFPDRPLKDGHGIPIAIWT